jgi:hypothetical protein
MRWNRILTLHSLIGLLGKNCSTDRHEQMSESSYVWMEGQTDGYTYEQMHRQKYGWMHRRT